MWQRVGHHNLKGGSGDDKNIFKGEIISESLVASPSQVWQKEEKIGRRKRKENLLKIARLLEDQRASAGEDPVGCEHINFPSQRL